MGSAPACPSGGGARALSTSLAPTTSTITTQAEFGHWFQDVGWGVENYGTDPDIEVDIKPQDWRAGRDPQMERALREIQATIRREKPQVPSMGSKPILKPPRLGKRT